MEDSVYLEYSEEELLNLAKKRIKLKRSMYSHIASYIVVNSFLILIYFLTRDPDANGIPWFVWPLGGWGVGLLLDIFGTMQDLRLTHNTRAVNRELEKIKRSINKK